MDFYIGAYWGPRKESASDCADRLATCLEGLSVVNETFTMWFERGRTKDDALRQPLNYTDNAELLRLLESGRNRRDTDSSVIEDLGYSVGLWNGSDGDRSASLTVACGLYASNPHLRNSVLLDFPKRLNELASREGALHALMAIVEAWDPDWAGLISRESRTSRPYSPGSPFVDWMIYQRGLKLDASQVPSCASVININELGSLIVTQDEAIDPENDAHLERVHAVERLLLKCTGPSAP